MKANYLKIAMAAALLFAVNMNADAQFGKLKSITDKAKSTTKKVEKAESKSSDAVSKAAKATMSPEEAEKVQLMMRMDFPTMHLYKMSHQERNRLLEVSLTYYRLAQRTGADAEGHAPAAEAEGELRQDQGKAPEGGKAHEDLQDHPDEPAQPSYTRLQHLEPRELSRHAGALPEQRRAERFVA